MPTEANVASVIVSIYADHLPLYRQSQIYARQGVEGILQVNGYAGYSCVLDLRDNAPVQLAYCWAHVRRKLHELTHNNVAPIAEEASNRSQPSTGSKRRHGTKLLMNA